MKRYLTSLLSFIMLFLAFNTQAESDATADFSDAELEQILAPIALYPDSVLTHILIAATYPLEVIQANRWVEKNPDMAPADAMDQIENEHWDPSVKALIPFPNVLKRLSDDLEWTQKLGDAFLQDEERVLDAIQSLRQKADKAGNLSQMENVKIIREEKVIVLEPAQPEVIYVPYYDTRVVYGPWYWDRYPPVYWHTPYYARHYRGPYYWYPSVHISFGFFFSAFHWHNRHVVVIDHHYRDHHYYRRSEIIRNQHVNRWHHNPEHRHGVAYRNNQVRERFNSNRPSQVQTRAIRNDERDIAVQGRLNKDNTRVVNGQRNQKIERPVTRQQRLREQLDAREDIRQQSDKKSSNRHIEKREPIGNSRNRQRDDRANNPREIKNRQLDDQHRAVMPKQNIQREEPVQREQRDTRSEQKDRRDVAPTKEEQNNKERDPPARQTFQSRQNEDRGNATRSNKSHRSERGNSQRNSRSNRNSDDHR